MTDPTPPLRWPPDLLSARPPSRLATALFLVALVVIAFWDLAGRSIFHRDLPRFAQIAREMLQGGDWWVPHQHGRPYVNKPILYIWLVAGPSALVGDPTAFLLRLPSALALVATGLATSMWARARTGSVAVGRLAALFVVTTTLTNELGRVGRPDMLATACSTAAAAFLDRAALGRGGRRDAWWAGLWLGAGMLAKGPVVLLVPAAVLLLPSPGTTLRARAARARPLLVLALGLVVPALWVVPAWLRGGDAFFRGLVVDQVKDRIEGRTAHREGPLYYLTDLPLVLLPWAPWTIGATLAACLRRVRARLGATLPLAVAVVLGVLSTLPTKEVRYAAVVVPLVAIVGAQAAGVLAARARDAARAASHLRRLGAAALVLALASVAAVVAWPPTLFGLLPLALVAAMSGVLAIARARRADEPAPATVGRVAGLAVVLVACATCAFWVIFARYLVIRSVTENADVAAVLPAGVSVALVMGTKLEPDDLYEAVRRPILVDERDAVPPATTHPDLVVVCLEPALAAATRARGREPTVLLRRPHEGGGTLVVARYAP